MRPSLLRSIGRWLTSGSVLRLLLLILTSLLALTALLFQVALRPASYSLNIGDVANQEIQAPRPISYTSTVLTDQARTTALAAVNAVYLPVDASIARGQIEKLHEALNYITSVRADAYASQDQKLQDLGHLITMQLQPETSRRILQLSDMHWLAVQQEAVNVLEQLMRSTIRENHVDEARRSIPNLISFALPQDEAGIVSAIVAPFTVPNSLYSADQTQAARELAWKSITPILRSYAVGETIVSRGQVITPVIHEALQQLDLISPQNHETDYIAAVAQVALAATFVGLYFYRRQPEPIRNLRSLILIAALFLIFLSGARYVIPNRTVIPYLYPIPAFGLTMAAVFNIEIGLVFSIVLSLLSGYGLPNSLDITIFYLFTSLSGVLILGRGRRIASFFWSSIAVGLAGIGAIFSYRLVTSALDWLGLATLAGAAVFNGFASASLALLIQFLISQLLGLTTALQLLEISRPDHPLLQFMLRSAPGTYQHSLQVANLAEQAAEAIGADGLLTRVGAIYHDSGKALNPQFFIENQPQTKVNPHDDLDPIVSAATIIRHVSDGLYIAKRHHLPPRVRDFISEHHGTLLAKYQYTLAVERADGDKSQVDIEFFRYPGPRPQSRETALLMLADGCEARARADTPKDDAELEKIIHSVFERCLREGQLDDTSLTLGDLSRAQASFFNTLKGLYHARIQYPELGQIPSSTLIPTRPLPPPNSGSLPAGPLSPGSSTDKP